MGHTVITVILAPLKNNYHRGRRLYKGLTITLPLGVAPKLRWRLIGASLRGNSAVYVMVLPEMVASSTYLSVSFGSVVRRFNVYNAI